MNSELIAVSDEDREFIRAGLHMLLRQMRDQPVRTFAKKQEMRKVSALLTKYSEEYNA